MSTAQTRAFCGLFLLSLLSACGDGNSTESPFEPEVDAGVCDGSACEPDACVGEGCEPTMCEGQDCEPGLCPDCDPRRCDGGSCKPIDPVPCEGDDCDPRHCDGESCDAGPCAGGDCNPSGCDGGACNPSTYDGGDGDAGSCDAGDCDAPDNYAPEITSGTTAESLSGAWETGYVAMASDPDGDALTWSIGGGADASRFSIDADSGALRFVQGPVYELATDSDGDNVFEVTLRVSDGELQSSLDVRVTVVRPDTSGLSPYERNLAIYRAARNVIYRCEITGNDVEGQGPYDLGNIYFGYARGLEGFDDGEVRFYPVEGCSNPEWIGHRTRQSQRCSFFDSGLQQWSLDVAGPGEELPLEITSVLHSADCDPENLAEEITPAICAAEYTCYAEEAARSDALRERNQLNFEAYQAALRTTYDCHVEGEGYDRGHVYFRYGYGAAGTALDDLYFYAVENCTVRPTGPTPVESRQSCVFATVPDGSDMRWSLHVGDVTEFGGDLPETLTQNIADPYDCGNEELQDGVTVEMCRAEYECTRIPDSSL